METNVNGSGGTRVSGAAETDSFRAAFARVDAEARAVSRDDLVHMNVDVPTVVSMLLGVLPRLATFREDLTKMPYFDITRFDKLRDLVHALGHTQVMHRAALSPTGAVPELAEKVTHLRDLLTSEAETLVTRKLLEAASLARFKSGPAYRNIAFDVLGLVELFRDRWEVIKERTGVKQAELDEADALARQLVSAVGLKEQNPATLQGAALLRQQVYTLVFRAYEDTRRAITYLRYHDGDFDALAPSLFVGRGRRVEPVEPELPEAQEDTDDSAAPPLAREQRGTDDPFLPVGHPESSPFVKS